MRENIMSNKTNTSENVTANAEVECMEIIAMNGKQKELTFYNDNLIKHTQQIQKFRDAGNLAILAIAHEFDSMERDESYKAGGFKTVAEYGRIVFDYKPATVSLYLRSARAFLTEDENGLVNYKPNLPKLSMGQMIELLPLVKDGETVTPVIEALKEGKINDRMSTKAMRDAVNSIRAIPAKAKEVEEKTDLEKAAKLGEYNADKLPKGQDSKSFALTSINASIEAFENFAKAFADTEHTEQSDAKVEAVVKALQELRAELTK